MPNERTAIKDAITSIKLDRPDFAEKLAVAARIHQEKDELFQKVYLRALRFNISPAAMLQIGAKYSFAIRDLPLVEVARKGHRRLDIALALGNVKLADSLIMKLVKAYDGPTGAKSEDKRYHTLELQIADTRKQESWSSLKYQVVLKSAIIGPDTVMKSIDLGIILGLSQRGQDDLQNLFLEVMNPLDARLTIIDGAKRARYILRGDITVTKHRREIADLDTKLAEEFKAELAQTFSRNNIQSLPQIKAVIIYPLLIAPLNTRKQRDMELSRKLIAAVKDLEPDPRLKLIIEQLDLPVSPDELRRS